jgi:hypothetical protein
VLRFLLAREKPSRYAVGSLHGDGATALSHAQTVCSIQGLTLPKPLTGLRAALHCPIHPPLSVSTGAGRPPNRTTAARSPQPNKRLPLGARKQSRRNKPTAHVTRERNKRRQSAHAIERRNPVRKVARQGKKNNLTHNTRQSDPCGFRSPS